MCAIQWLNTSFAYPGLECKANSTIICNNIWKSSYTIDINAIWSDE